MLRRHRLLAHDPLEQILIVLGHQRFKLIELLVIKVANHGIAESAEDQIHLPHATMPRTKHDLAPARVEVSGGVGGSGHRLAMVSDCLGMHIEVKSVPVSLSRAQAST